MEGLAAAGGVIAVVSLAGQVLQGCSYVQQVFEGVQTAPEEIRLLNTELAVIERIVQTVPDDGEHKDALDFCNEAVAKLRNIIDKYAETDGPGRYRKWGRRLSMALSTDKLQKHLGRLRQARTYLQDLQHLSAQSQHFVGSKEVLESVRQLKDSQFESATIVSRTEGKLEELSKTTKDTQRAFHDFAGRIIQQNKNNCFPDGQYIQRIEAKLEQLFAEHISKVAFQEIPKPTSTHDAVGQFRRLRNKQSELSRTLADLMKPLSTKGLQEAEVQDSPELEAISTYKTWLGEVYMRTVAITHFSADEIVLSTFPSCFESFSKSTNFPITLSKTDILLLPRTWSQNRAASIRCQQLLGPTSKISDISFEIQSFSGSCRPKEGKWVGGMDYPQDIKGKVAKLSQPLIYTAFKTAFIATQARDSKQYRSKLPMTQISIRRTSFDNEVNDIIELVHLWISSGLDADFYRDAFPDDMTQTIEQSESVLQARNKRLWPVQRLRHEYVFKLVVAITSKYNRDEWFEGGCLHPIHQDHWERCQMMASTSAVGITVQSSSSYQASCLSPVFSAARNGDIPTLRRLFDARLASPFVCTPAGTSLLESAIISAERNLMRLWCPLIPAEKKIEIDNDDEAAHTWPRFSWHYHQPDDDPWCDLTDLFNTIQFLIDLGLRLDKDPRDFQHNFIISIKSNGRTVYSPHWRFFLDKTSDGTGDWFDRGRRDEFETFHYLVIRACNHLAEFDWHEQRGAPDEADRHDPESSFLGAYRLLERDMGHCRCNECTIRRRWWLEVSDRNFLIIFGGCFRTQVLSYAHITYLLRSISPRAMSYKSLLQKFCMSFHGELCH